MCLSPAAADWTASAKVVLIGQSMGGIISAAATQHLAAESLVDGAIPVSAGGARRHVADFPPTARVPVLHLHGIYDAVIPTCMPPAALAAAGMPSAPFPAAPPGCDDERGHTVCRSEDGYLYASLQTTLESYSRAPLTPWKRLGWSSYRTSYFAPGDVRNGTSLRCAAVAANVTVCLFNGFHCLPYQDSSCGFIDDDPAPGTRNCTGAMAFAELVRQWLNDGNVPRAVR